MRDIDNSEPAASGSPHGIAGEPGTLRRVFVASFGVGALAFALLAAPYLLDPGHIVDDVMHSNAIPVATGCTLLLFVMGLAGLSGFRRDRSSVTPPDRSWRVLGGMFAVGLALIAFWTWRDYRLAAYLAGHGVPAQARLIRQLDKSCGKTGCTIELEYSFVPQGRLQPASGFAKVGYRRRDPDPAYVYAVSTGTVPILYDPNRPSRSILYWRDQVARRGATKNALEFAALLTALLMAGIAPLALGTWLVMRKRAAARASEQ